MTLVPKTTDRRIVLLSGMPRVGKTRLAARIAARSPMTVIHTDRLQTAFWGIADFAERSAERDRAYTEALEAAEGHTLLEGADLMYRNLGDPALVGAARIKQDLTMDFALLESLSRRFGATVLLVGCADAMPLEKKLAIERYQGLGCWTRRFSADQLGNLAVDIVRQSMIFKAEAGRLGFHYIELPPDASDDHLDSTAASVLPVFGVG